MAGGAVLAILSDYRYFDKDHGRISFAEVKVGIPVPSGISDLIGAVCHRPHLRDITMLGKNLDAQHALEAGLADGAATGDELETMVAKQVERLSRMSTNVLRNIKGHLRKPMLPGLEKTLQGDAKTHEFAQFVEAEYLGEGLTALLEGRAPAFTK
jgi:enoyl-CoA hydratase/carnithine racemase